MRKSTRSTRRHTGGLRPRAAVLVASSLVLGAAGVALAPGAPAQPPAPVPCTDGSTPALNSVVGCQGPLTSELTVPPRTVSLSALVVGAGGAGVSTDASGGNGAYTGFDSITLPEGTRYVLVIAGEGGAPGQAPGVTARACFVSCGPAGYLGGGGSSVSALDASHHLIAKLAVAGGGGAAGPGSDGNGVPGGGGDAGTSGGHEYSDVAEGGRPGGDDGTGGAGGTGVTENGPAGASDDPTSPDPAVGGAATLFGGGGGGGYAAGGAGGSGWVPGNPPVGYAGGGGGGSTWLNPTYVSSPIVTQLQENSGGYSGTNADPAGKPGGVLLMFSGYTQPDPPTAVTAVAGVERATVSWTAPADDRGYPVSGYTVTSSPGDRTCETTASQATSCTVLGLTGSTVYSFTVKADSGTVQSAASAPSNLVSPAGRPSVPVAPEYTPSRTGFDVFFHKPADDRQSAILGYRISVNGGATWQELSFTGPSTGPYRARVTGLAPGRTYQVRMQAYNANGYGDAIRPPAAVTTLPAAVPSGPVGIEASATSVRGQVRLFWHKPFDDGGSAIRGYRVSLNGGGSWQPVVVRGPSTGPYSAYVSGLAPGRTYQVRMQAWNTVGYGAAPRTPVPVTVR